MFFLSSYDHFQRKLIIIAKSQGFFPWLFSLSWEQRKLSDYLTTSPEKNISGLYTKEDVLSVSGDVGIVNQIEFQGRSFAGASVLNYGIVETGDVVYTKSPLRSNPYGIIKANKGKPGIVSTLYAIYHPSPLADPDFIQCYFEQDARVNNYLHPLVNKGAKNDMKVSADNALKGIVRFPSVKEQQTISSFFKSLDDLITLHQHEPLFLVMLFSGGRYVFKSAWEQRKLSDIADKVIEKNAGLQYVETFTNSAEYGVISQRDFFDHDISKMESLDGYYVVREEDFVYNPRISVTAPVGPINRNKLGRIGVMSPLYTVFRTHDIDTTYLEHYFKSVYWHSFMRLNGDSGARSDRFSIKDSLFFEMPIPYPDIVEQRKIGEWLTSLDDLITLHQRKGDLSEKKARDFAWEQRKLGELVDRVVRKNTNNESSLPLTISAQYGLVDQITYFNNRVASRDVSNYYLLFNGEFAYNKSTSEGFPFGAVKRLDLYEKGVLSTLYIVFSINEKQIVDSDFLTVFFDTDRWHKGVSERAAEGARNHGLLNISAEDFFDIDITIPKNKAEQAAIGAFIRSLDDLITLHQREHKSNFGRKTNVKQSTRDRPFLLLLCSVDKGIQRGSGP